MPLTVFALSACGGGSPSLVPPSPAAIPTATPAPNPTASGDTFAYTGSLTQTFTLYATPAPAPSAGATPEPTATPWTSIISQAVTQNVAVSTGQSFGGQTGLTELATQETDASRLKTTSITSQAYLWYAADASRADGVDVTQVGSSSTSDGVSLQSAIGAGNGIVEKLPSVYGAQWSNAATRTDTEKDASGETVSATYAADGSYQEQLTYPEGANATVQTNGDGSGLYTLPFQSVTTKPSSITVNAPSGGQIQLAVEIYGVGMPQAAAFTVPVWYPQTPPVLAADTYMDEGSATLPSTCGVAKPYQSDTVEKVVETKKRLDTVFGEYETDRVTQYVSPSYGLLCAVVNGDLKTYYDYSGQQPAAFAFSGAPLEDMSVSETLGLQSQHLASMSSSARRSDAISSRPVLVRPSLARVHIIFAAVHAQHVRAVYERAHSISGTRQTQ